MEQDEFTRLINQRRSKLICKADRYHINNFARKPSRIILSLLIIVILLIGLITGKLIFEGDKINNIYTTNIINTINKTELIIKGERYATCIGNLTSNQMICYKEK